MTTIIVEGSKAELNHLRSLLTLWTSQNYRYSDFGYVWLGNIALGAGLPIDGENSNDFNCCGFVDYIGSINTVHHNKGIYSLKIEYESAWRPANEIWETVFQKYAPSCHFYWYAEEPGSEVYMSNDIAKKYFDHDYVLDCNVSNDNVLAELNEWDRDVYAGDLKEVLIKVFGPKPIEELIASVHTMKFAPCEYLRIHKVDYIENRKN